VIGEQYHLFSYVFLELSLSSSGLTIECRLQKPDCRTHLGDIALNVPHLVCSFCNLLVVRAISDRK